MKKRIYASLFLTFTTLFSLFGNPPHIKARSQENPLYPLRSIVPDELVSWQTHFIDYAPLDYTADIVLQKPLWADNENISSIDFSTRKSFEGAIILDEHGFPLNPKGRTGLKGRGLLGKWGPNHAADPIVTRISAISGKLEMVLIQRKDNRQWAIPGGMVDNRELITATLKRELEEETHITLDFSKSRKVYQGYVDDPRNTDNAWMETSAFHLHLESALFTPEAGDDAAKANWVELNRDVLEGLYASHAEFIKSALNQFKEKEKLEFSNAILEQIEELTHP